MRFILIDKILALEPGERIQARKDVLPEEDYFRDHFPGYPVVPGVLLIEMIAQAAGRCVMAVEGSEWPVLAQVRQANFRNPVLPGSSLVIEVDVTHRNQKLASAQGKVLFEGRTMAEASIVLAFIPKAQLMPGFVDPVLKAYLDGGVET